MSTILGNDFSSNRLVEAIAGSTGSTVQPDVSSNELTALPLGNLLDDLSTQDVAGGDLAGPGTTLQPLLDTANTTITEVHTELELLGFELGLENTVHHVISLGEVAGLAHIGTTPPALDGHTNLVTDVLNAPSDLLDGQTDQVISNLGHDLTDTVQAASALKDSVIFDTSDPSNPVPELISSLGHDVSSLPLLSVNNGGPGAGLLNGSILDLSHSSTNHLADADVGPASNENGLIFNLLSQPEAGPHSSLGLNLIDVGPTGPHLGDLSILTGSGLGLSGGGADGIVGDLLHTVGLNGSDSGGLGGITSGIPAIGGAGADGLVGHVLDSLPLQVGNVLNSGAAAPATNAGALPIPALHDVASIPDVLGSLTGGHDGQGLHNLHLI